MIEESQEWDPFNDAHKFEQLEAMKEE